MPTLYQTFASAPVKLQKLTQPCLRFTMIGRRRKKKRKKYKDEW